MGNRFFFITAYDSTCGSVLSTLLNTHPEIECRIHYTDPFLPENIQQPETTTKKLDEIINASLLSGKKFIGCAQQFSAFELQTKSLTEKTVHPYRNVNMTVSPQTRINYILASWLNTHADAATVLKNIKSKVVQLQTQNHPLYSLYIYDYYLQLIYNSVKSEKSADLNIAENELFIYALAKVIAMDSANMPSQGKKFSFETLAGSSVAFIEFMNYLSCGNINMADEFTEQLDTNLVAQRAALEQLAFPAWQAWQTELLDKLIHTKLFSVYYPHVDTPLAAYYAAAGYALSPAEQSDTPFYTKLISIQLNSNRPAQLAAYFDNVEETADRPEDIEVLINIDIGDQAMKALLENEVPKRKFTLKFMETQRPATFCGLWKSSNALYAITDPDAYFLLNISDEMLFATQGWDTLLKNYIGYFHDHIFRLRASRNKFRNYFDRWECSFAQDCIPITTKKWLDIGGDWNPCFGPDSFQQLVAFYLAKEGIFSNENYLREAPIIDIKFAGDVPMLGIDATKAWKHGLDHIKGMQICQSYPMQLEAKRRALMLKAHIIAEARQLKNYAVIYHKALQQIRIINTSDNTIIEKFNCKLSWLAITLTNQWRKLAFFKYFGEGITQRFNRIKTFLQYLKARYLVFRGLHRLSMRVRGMNPNNPPAKYPAHGEQC
jgi:hypothetical protein